MTLLWNSIEALRTTAHVLMWLAGTGALVACVATPARFYVDRRIAALSAIRALAEKKDQAAREAALVEQVGLANARADRAARQASEAATSAARHIARLPTQDVLSHVNEELGRWVSKYPKSIVNLTVVGTGQPTVDAMLATLTSAFERAKVPIGRVTTIGQAGGMPHGAIVSGSVTERDEARELSAALSALIRDIKAQDSDNGGPVTILLNGKPAFEPDGSLRLE